MDILTYNFDKIPYNEDKKREPSKSFHANSEKNV